MKKLWVLIVVLMVFSLPVVLAEDVESEEGDDSLPDGSVLVLNIKHKVVNDEDSGNVGYWALDNYNRQIKVWKLPDGTFYVRTKYEGKWKTFAGALSPGSGAVQSKDASGGFKGGYTATFDATSVTPTFGNIGTFDYGGTKADVLLGTYGAGQTGPTTPFSWSSTYFSGVSNFDYIHWGWTYKYKNQKWINSDAVTTGDIIA